MGSPRQVILEDHTAVPSWEAFHRRPKHFAFETEISFLAHHYSLIKEAKGSEGICVFDFSPLQDMAYADVNLSLPQKRAFEGLFRQVRREIGQPAVLVHLVCSGKEELRRIKRRGRAVEGQLDTGYLDELNHAIGARVDQLPPGVRVVTIDSEAKDFAYRSSGQQDAIELILREVEAREQLRP